MEVGVHSDQADSRIWSVQKMMLSYSSSKGHYSFAEQIGCPDSVEYYN